MLFDRANKNFFKQCALLSEQEIESCVRRFCLKIRNDQGSMDQSWSFIGTDKAWYFQTTEDISNMQLTVRIWMINENWKDFTFYLSWGRFFKKICLWALESLIWDNFLRMKSLHKLSHWFYLGHASYLCHLGAPCGKQKI